MEIFKVSYTWYDGEEGSSLLGKEVSLEEFERDLKEAIVFSRSLLGIRIEYHLDFLGKGYRVECLPEYYEQIVWFLINKKSYVECFFNDNVEYKVIDEEFDEREGFITAKISVEKCSSTIYREYI